MLSTSLSKCPQLFSLQTAGISRYRRQHGLYSYKIGKNQLHKNPHAIPLRERQLLKSQGYKGELKIHERERLSQRPFGQHDRKGRFRFDVEKVPFYNVPDLTGFKLKPYVPHSTPKINEDKRVERIVEIDEGLLARIDKQIEDASRGRLEAVEFGNMDRKARR